MSVLLEETLVGVTLPVKAIAGARRNGIVGMHAGCLKVAVTQVPEKGKANSAIAEVLAERLELSRCQLQLIAGATSARKKFLVTGVTLDELRRRIERLWEA